MTVWGVPACSHRGIHRRHWPVPRRGWAPSSTAPGLWKTLDKYLLGEGVTEDHHRTEPANGPDFKMGSLIYLSFLLFVFWGEDIQIHDVWQLILNSSPQGAPQGLRGWSLCGGVCPLSLLNEFPADLNTSWQEPWFFPQETTHIIRVCSHVCVHNFLLPFQYCLPGVRFSRVI